MKEKQIAYDYEPIVNSKISNIVQISVKDNGNGIPQNCTRQNFSTFFTTNQWSRNGLD
jgi:C4-dicarboxylate-specific signal transduction histidine kinase